MVFIVKYITQNRGSYRYGEQDQKDEESADGSLV